jgi:hypothetical protein
MSSQFKYLWAINNWIFWRIRIETIHEFYKFSVTDNCSHKSYHLIQTLLIDLFWESNEN